MCKISIISQGKSACRQTYKSGCDVCSRTRTARIFAERFCGYWREGGGDLFFGTWANTQQQTTHIHGTSESTSINNQHWSLAQILNSRPQIGYTQSWSINLYHQLSPNIFYQQPLSPGTDSSGGNKHVSGFSHTCVENGKHLQTYNCVAFFTHVCLFPYICVKIQTCVENST